MEEFTDLIARSQAGEKDARRILVEKNLGLVYSIVRRFTGRGTEMEDLTQIGSIGLLKAIDKFDLSMGLQFSTYAVPMITGEIKRFLRDDGMIKISRSVKENGVRVRLARQALQIREGREPTLQELAKESGLKEEDIVTALEAGIEVESIYSSYKQVDGSETCLADRLVKNGKDGVGRELGGFCDREDEEKEELLNHMLIEQLLELLNEEERGLIKMRYFQNKTQNEVAKMLGMNQVQVSRMEKRILLFLRESAMK